LATSATDYILSWDHDRELRSIISGDLYVTRSWVFGVH
jgi:hypothetical protein